ncbi:hypothetical protein D9M73_137050 [compost metagenome]
MADDGHAVLHHHLFGLGQRAVAALGRGEVDDHRTRLHLLHGGFVQQRRRLATRDQRGGDHDVGLLGTLVHRLGLALHPTGRHWSGIAANAFGALSLLVGLVGYVDEFCTQ